MKLYNYIEALTPQQQRKWQEKMAHYSIMNGLITYTTASIWNAPGQLCLPFFTTIVPAAPSRFRRNSWKLSSATKPHWFCLKLSRNARRQPVANGSTATSSKIRQTETKARNYPQKTRMTYHRLTKCLSKTPLLSYFFTAFHILMTFFLHSDDIFLMFFSP